MIHIRVGQQQTLMSCLKSGNTVMENLQHFLPIAGITTVHTEKFSMAFNHRSITSASRLNQDNFGIVRNRMCGDSRNKLIPLGFTQKLSELADAVKGPVRRQPLLVQNLHGKIGRNHEALLLLIR